MVQALHVLALATAGWRLLGAGDITLLAPAPPEGWSEQARYFLVGLGALDALVALIVLALVWRYLRGRGWNREWGIACLTASTFSAGIYAYVAVVSGAYRQEPAFYGALAALFLPILLFFVLELRSAREGRGG
jgi:hypothetical protein